MTPRNRSRPLPAYRRPGFPLFLSSPSRLFLWTLVMLALSWLSGCRASAPVSLPTPITEEMLSTFVALTHSARQTTEARSRTKVPTPVPTLIVTSDATATRTLPPSNTLTPTPGPYSTATGVVTSTPSLTPTVTLTPKPVIPPGAIRIQSPAPLSKVLSPIDVRAVLVPGAGGIFRIELLGEDGRLLARQVLTYSGERVNANVTLEFEIPGVAETGRLQVYTQDEFGRTTSLSSVNILLLSVGSSEYNPSGDLRERVMILQPAPEDSTAGGVLTVVGKARPDPASPLLIELITREGAVVGQRLIAVTAEPGEDYATFIGEIPYQISEPVYVRVTIYEDIDRIPGKTHISTVEILLNP